MIYVDCDDTLILYSNDKETNPYGAYMGDAYEMNWKLIEALENVDGDKLCVWSGGGAQYAEMWRRGYLPHAKYNASKNISLPKKGDICIDDQPLVVDADCVTWEEYLNDYNS